MRLRSHTAAGERGAGFGRSGQAVSKECGPWSRGAGVRAVMEPLYGEAKRKRYTTASKLGDWHDKRGGNVVSTFWANASVGKKRGRHDNEDLNCDLY